jgi:formyl-CoA transferase
MVFMLDFQASRWLLAGQVAGQAGNDHPTVIPTGVYPTADRSITISASSPRMWARFCEALGQREWLERVEWSTRDGRSEHRADINRAIAGVTATQPSLHWIELLDEIGIPCGPINTIDKVFEDPQVEHLRLARPVTHPRLGEQRLVGTPITFDGLANEIRKSTSELGEHGGDILAELGYDDATIEGLRSKGVI